MKLLREALRLIGGLAIICLAACALAFCVIAPIYFLERAL